MTDLEITTVPRDLYYHEAAYVRGLETALREARSFISEEGDGEPDVLRTINDALKGVSAWTDAKGTVWTAPTAQAYALTCKALETTKAQLDEARTLEGLAMRSLKELTATLENSTAERAALRAQLETAQREIAIMKTETPEGYVPREEYADVCAQLETAKAALRGLIPYAMEQERALDEWNVAARKAVSSARTTLAALEGKATP